MKIKFISALLCFLTILSCGDESGSNLSDLIEEIDAKRAGSYPLQNSYIVALKAQDQNPSRSLYFRNQKHEFLYYNQSSKFDLTQPEIKHVQLIGAVDLRIVDGGEKTTYFTQPHSQQNKWAIENKPAIAMFARVDFIKDEGAQKTIQKWQDQGRIWFVEPNYVSQLNDCGWSEGNPDDLFTTCQQLYQGKGGTLTGIYNKINLIEALAALSQRTVVNGVNDDSSIVENRPIIAVLDSGVDVNHPALNGRIWQNQPANIGEAGCVNDVYGCNTTASFKDKLGDGDIFPATTTGHGQSCQSTVSECHHGTFVASIAVGNNASHNVLGICPVCRVMPIKIVGKIDGTDNYGILDSSILAGLKYITRFDSKSSGSAIRIVNASFGKYTRSKAVGVFVDLIHDKRNAVVIGAAGNEDSNRMSYVAGFNNAIAVAALDEQNHKAAFSNFGSWVDIAAPGTDLPGAKPGGATDSGGQGTSYAAPIVAGVAGLLVAQNPTISSREIKRWLLDTADPSIYSGDAIHEAYAPKIAGNSERTPLLGRGIINAGAAVKRETNANQIPTGPDMDRVRGFCGTVSTVQHAYNPLVVILILIAPILFCCGRLIWTKKRFRQKLN